ncbi:alpha/beta hydrolase family protein [Sarocladium implicatum]|nr:alpha/beta hydrolase family protein [Sarocladium implicatum]
MAQPLIVIVPGGFVKPEAYDGVAKELSQLGYTTKVLELTVYGDLSNETPDSPAWKEMADKGCLDDVKMIMTQITPEFEEGREVVLLGHSYGTLPATISADGQSVAERHARGEKGGIKALVNLAGFAYPARGKNIIGTDDDMPPMPYQVLEVGSSKPTQRWTSPSGYELEELNEPQAGILRLQEETGKPLFFSDISPAEQDHAWNTLLHKTQSYKSLQHRPDVIAADLKLPKYYIRTVNDEMVNADYQAAFIQYGGFDGEFEVRSGHCPMVSAPGKLAEVIDAIAKR